MILDLVAHWRASVMSLQVLLTNAWSYRSPAEIRGRDFPTSS
jgi:hypothetical protein